MEEDMAGACALPRKHDELLAAIQLLRARLHTLPAPGMMDAPVLMSIVIVCQHCLCSC